MDKKTGRPSKFVIGCQRPSTWSYWKIPLLCRGQSPVNAEDPEVAPMIAHCVNQKKTLTATYNSDCLSLADCVVKALGRGHIQRIKEQVRSRKPSGT